MTPVYPRPFEVKAPELLADMVTGFARLHPDALEILEFVCEVSWSRWQIRPVVTCFGRTHADQEDIYYPVYLQSLEHQGVTDAIAKQQARELARNRFSWHCVDSGTAFFRAFDVRDWLYLPTQRLELVQATAERFPKAEIMDHAIQGGARHFHFGAPDPDGKPERWL